MEIKKKISIVIPVYFNELDLPYSVPELLKLASDLKNYDVELIFVDDGSGDNSLDLLLDIKKKHKLIKIIKLSRNFGSMIAVQAGIRHASGDCIGIIAADLQDPPKLFLNMIEKWENGYKVILAIREDREESKIQKTMAALYYFILRKIAFPDYPDGGFDFVLFDRQIAEELKMYSGKNTNIMSLIFSLGHKRYCIPYTRGMRKFGKSRWTFWKKINLLIDSLVSFSYLPVRFMSFIGITIAFGSFIYGLFVCLNYFRGNILVPGWTALIIILSFFLGLIMIMLGIIGEYLWRNLDESRKSPLFIIDELFE